LPYWRAALANTVFMAPNAPEICPGAPGGYQLWSLADVGRESRAAGVRQAAPLVNAFIDMHRTTYDLPNNKVALLGFSQGTMMALHVGPRRPEAMAGIVGYSGMLADAEDLLTELKTKPPPLLVRGTRRRHDLFVRLQYLRARRWKSRCCATKLCWSAPWWPRRTPAAARW
jgi:phospholipase/carboxylesterase